MVVVSRTGAVCSFPEHPQVLTHLLTFSESSWLRFAIFILKLQSEIFKTMEHYKTETIWTSYPKYEGCDREQKNSYNYFTYAKLTVHPFKANCFSAVIRGEDYAECLLILSSNFASIDSNLELACFYLLQSHGYAKAVSELSWFFKQISEELLQTFEVCKEL